ncbi:MAG: cytochrome c biogenesis CcdA family protein [Chitinophagales bacterium]
MNGLAGGLSLLGAFTAGVLSFLAPCCLPMVPVYLAYLAGQGEKGRRHLVAQSILFTLGFTAVFVALGASASLIGQILLFNRALLRRLAGVILAVFGLHLAGILRFSFMERGRMLFAAAPKAGRRAGWRSFLLGVAFSAGWQPCVGPVLGGILALAGAQHTFQGGVLLLLAYSFGLAAPFVIAAAGLEWFRRRLPWLLSRSEAVRRFSGWLLILMGVLVFFDLFARLSNWLPWRPFL